MKTYTVALSFFLYRIWQGANCTGSYRLSNPIVNAVREQSKELYGANQHLSAPVGDCVEVLIDERSTGDAFHEQLALREVVSG